MSKTGFLASILPRSGAHQGLIYTVLGEIVISMPIIRLFPPEMHLQKSSLFLFLTLPKAFLQPAELLRKWNKVSQTHPTLSADVSAFSGGYPLLRWPTTRSLTVLTFAAEFHESFQKGYTLASLHDDAEKKNNLEKGGWDYSRQT
jgi:hypothetical protein